MSGPSDCWYWAITTLLFPKPSSLAVPLWLLWQARAACEAPAPLYSQPLAGVFFPQGPVEHVQLLTPFVVIRNKEVNITALVLPSHSRTVTYFWWLGNNTEVIVPSTRFQIVHMLYTQLHEVTLMEVGSITLKLTCPDCLWCHHLTDCSLPASLILSQSSISYFMENDTKWEYLCLVQLP